MSELRFRFDPLDPAQFPVGQSPFRVRGLAYVSVLDYLRRKTPRGLQQFESMLEGDPFLPYYQQLFVPLGDYDAVPLVRLFLTAAAFEGVAPARFVEDRAKGSARSDADGIWKPLLSAKTLEQMVERMPVAFNRYYEPCRARVLEVGANAFTGELESIPAPINGLYSFSTQGFVGECLHRAGAGSVRFAWRESKRQGELRGVPLESLRFEARWG
jgi:hypothetical protein